MATAIEEIKAIPVVSKFEFEPEVEDSPAIPQKVTVGLSHTQEIKTERKEEKLEIRKSAEQFLRKSKSLPSVRALEQEKTASIPHGLIKSHIWKSPKNKHLNDRCTFCSKHVPLTSPILKCKICFLKAHKTCATALIDSRGCRPLHEKLIYDPEIADRTPLLVFINPKSGAQNGPKLYAKFSKLLGKGQVFNLQEGGPEVGLKRFFSVQNIRILVAGGDGTVAWVLQCIDSLQFPQCPPVSILPLGTGNDLARSFKWGGGYNGEKILPLLEWVLRSQPVLLDRWKLNIETDSGLSPKIMNNYFSIGTDADIAIGFHKKRNENPELFKNRVVNKMWYVFYGSKLLGKHETPLKNTIQLEMDGEICPLADDITGIIVLNLQSYAGGANLWGETSKEEEQHLRCPTMRPSFNDGFLEVVGVTGVFDMGTVASGLAKPRKLGQTRSLQITCKKKTQRTLQLDGEPWVQDGPFSIKICIHDQATMLMNTRRT